MKKFSKLLVVALLFGLLMTGCKMKEEIGFSINANKKMSFRFIYAMDDQMIDAMMQSGTSSEEDEDEYTEEIKTEEDSEAVGDTGTTGTTEEPVTTTEAPTTTETPTVDAPSEETTGIDITSSKEITDEMRWEYLEKSVKEDFDENYKLEKYEKDDLKGYIVTREMGNFEDFVGTDETRVSISEDIVGKKLFVKTDKGYKSIMKLDKSSSDVSSASQYEQMGAMFDLSFVVVLPNKSLSNNATSVSEDGLTLTWNLLTLTDENIDFEFKFDAGANNKTDATSSNLMLYLGIGGLVLLVVIVIVIIATRKKDDADNLKPYEDTPSNKEFLNAVQDKPVEETKVEEVPETPEVPEEPVETTEPTEPEEPVVHIEPFEDDNQNN